MKDNVNAFLLAAALTTVPMVGFAAVNTGDTVGMTETDIRTALESHGYVIQEIETEEDELEVEASLNGVLYEIEISPQTGKVLEIEEEDD